MFTRTELELLSLRELRILASRYSVKPMGNPNFKTSWMTALMSFGEIAVRQMIQGKGIKNPSWKKQECLEVLLIEIGNPTEEQASLIRITLEERRRLIYPSTFDQYRLLNLYKAKSHIEQAINLLNQ